MDNNEKKNMLLDTTHHSPCHAMGRPASKMSLAQTRDVSDPSSVETTDVLVVGAGPAGLMLAYFSSLPPSVQFFSTIRLSLRPLQDPTRPRRNSHQDH